MNLLVFSDLHIKKEELIECELVLNEIVSLCQKYNVDQVINLGDTFDVLRPESECLDLFSKFLIKLNRPINILAAQSHESTNAENSILNHFQILYPGVKVFKEYIDEKYLYAGHFFLNESNVNYGSSRKASEFSEYRFCLLGHQHGMQSIGKNILHLGSCRFIDFAEAGDKAKVVLLIEDYKGNGEKTHLIGLKSIYPMKDIIIDQNEARIGGSAKSEGKKWQDILDSLPSKTKIRLVFKDFASYSNSINELEKYKNKFTIFKIKHDYILENTETKVEKKDINIQESLNKYLDSNNINKEIKDILLNELK